MKSSEKRNKFKETAEAAAAGMGNPVKCFLCALAKSALLFAANALTLKRTRRKTPQIEKIMAAVVTKKESLVPGRTERLFKIMTEGATPKEIASAKESKIPPKSLSALITLAIAPSSKSAN